MKKAKINLISENKDDYSPLETILELYATGELKRVFSEYEGIVTNPEFHKTNGKSDKAIQISFHYHNIYVVIDFFEKHYQVVNYPSGTSAADLENLFAEYEYPKDFTLKNLIQNIGSQIKNHPKLKDTTFVKKKKKIYSSIAWISLCAPLIVVSVLGLYCIVAERALTLNERWAAVFIVIPLLLWFIFDIKAKKLK